MTAARNIDAEARQARERFELAIVRGDAQGALDAGRDMLAVVEADGDYELLSVRPHERETAPSKGDDGPREITSQFDSRCTGCGGAVTAGKQAFWTPGTKGVRCMACGEGR